MKYITMISLATLTLLTNSCSCGMTLGYGVCAESEIKLED